jgi:hypothetical protein
MDAGPAFAGSRGALQQQTQTKSNEKRSNPFNQTKKTKKIQVILCVDTAPFEILTRFIY